MTSTRRWLESRRRELARMEARSGWLLAAGVVLALLGAGVALARLGLYLRAPLALIAMWLAPAGAIAGMVWWYRRRARALAAPRLAAVVETQGGLRRGSLVGVAGDEPVRGSEALTALADARASAWLSAHGDGALGPDRTRRARTARRAGGVAAAGVVLFVAAQPTSNRAASFWHPIATVARTRGPVRVQVDRLEVRRGERVRVGVEAVGRSGATLWTRGPGEPWQPTVLALDSLGVASVELGPLESDRFIRATAGGRNSETIRVRVALPSFLAELSIVARYPDYLGLADEPLVAGSDTVLVPVGTLIATAGRATVPLRSAGWVHDGGSTGLVTSGQEFSGEARVRRSGTWRLLVTPAGGGVLEDAAPMLHLLAVLDSVPSVTVPVPGADTTAPATLKQPLVIDVRDDNRVTGVELISRRVSRSGITSGRQTETIPVPDGGAERLVLQWLLDLNGRGYNPGDTAYFRVRVYDNAPTPQMAETREYVLRLPTLAEMREAVRAASRDLTGAVDSLLQAQAALAEETEDAAQERERLAAESAREGEDAKQLPYQAAETAEDLAQRQQEVLDRAEELREQVRELSEAAKAAGLNDPQFHQQLRDLQQMMDRATTPELREQLAKLREAVEQLDAEQSRQRMQQLSESARQLQEQLERSKEMFQRAAIEGTMTTLASDAEDLAERQRDWNEATKGNPDSGLADAEGKMASEADSLAARLEALQKMMEQAKDRRSELQDSVRAADSLKLAQEQRREQQPDSGALNRQDPESGDRAGPQPTQAQQAREAAQDMRDASQEAERRNLDKARGEGEEASQKLDPMAQQLRKSRDEMRAAWKAEVVGKMDHALAETAELARRQDEIAERLQRGEAGADLRGQQAALKEGMDQVIERLRSAAGQNALVSPEIATAMGYARMRMKEALEQLQQPVPNTRSAATIAGQAVTGLTSVAYSLLTAREDVQSSGSGSGFSEAVERLANMAGSQSALAGQSGQLLPIWQRGQGEESKAQLRRIGAQQRRIADELDRLDAQGNSPSGVEQLAEEARQLSREMEGGQLDRRTVERQERLFRRLLDAGRTLTGDDEDDEKERKSETARSGNVLIPPRLAPGAAGAGPRFPYPTWEELRQLSPEERRLILDYFRRLNDAR